MVQGAVYDAVNAIDRGHQPYLLDLDASASQPFGLAGCGVATAAHDVLVAIVAAGPGGRLSTPRTGDARRHPGRPTRPRGSVAGEAAAAAMLAARTGDGFLAPFQFVIGPDPGDWRPSGGRPHRRSTPTPGSATSKPFLIESPSQFRSEGPNPLTSAAYTKDFNEVKELGALNSATRTADQTTAAIFWQFAPVAIWNPLSRDLAAAHGLDTVERPGFSPWSTSPPPTARSPAGTTSTTGTSGVPWRRSARPTPTGTRDTVADPTWKPLFDPSTPTSPPLATPPFPDHPSGHGCVSGAVLHTSQDFFGTDKIELRRVLGPLPRPAPALRPLLAALKEIIDARVWGGIHFRTADVQGAVIGKKVAHWLEATTSSRCADHSFRRGGRRGPPRRLA